MRTALAQWKSFGPVLVVMAIGCLLPSQAAAQVVYHTGEDAFDVADLGDDVMDAIAEKMGVPAEEKPAMKAALAGQKVGYKCQIFGLLWAYFAWWDCEPIMFKWADSETFEFMPLDPAKISDPDDKALATAITEAFEKKAGGKKFAEAYSMSDANMGVWKRHGRFVLGGVILLLIVLAVLRKRKAQSGAPVAPQG